MQMHTHILPSIWIASSATWVAISELYRITAAQSYIVNMHTSANVLTLFQDLYKVYSVTSLITVR